MDIDLAVSYLCTRVSCSTDDDWEKLRRLLHYLHGTIDMPRIIGAGEDMDILQTYVDASYTIHGDMKGHIGVRGAADYFKLFKSIFFFMKICLY